MCRFNGFADPRHFLRFAVIHNDDMARMQLGGQDLVDVAAKHITVCAALHGHCRYESLHSYRTNHRHGPAPIVRLGGIRALSSWRPRIGTRHIDMALRLIDKDQVVHLLLSDQLLEGRTGLASFLSVLFRSVERLFSRVRLSCLSTCCIVLWPMYTGVVAATCAQRSAKEASGCY